MHQPRPQGGERLPLPTCSSRFLSVFATQQASFVCCRWTQPISSLASIAVLKVGFAFSGLIVLAEAAPPIIPRIVVRTICGLVRAKLGIGLILRLWRTILKLGRAIALTSGIVPPLVFRKGLHTTRITVPVFVYIASINHCSFLLEFQKFSAGEPQTQAAPAADHHLATGDAPHASARSDI
jgi:hypothetical protein